MSGRQNVYVLGHRSEELARLDRQAVFFAYGTGRILQKAGLRSGMRVLDLGCGTGDLTMLAMRLVGPTGKVTGIDLSESALTAARQRSIPSGHVQPVFSLDDISEPLTHGKFDAIIGRFILLHCQEPCSIVQNALGSLHPGGVMCFLEMDITSTSMVPRMDQLQICLVWIETLYRKLGLEPDMGSRLFSIFRFLGLTPRLYAETHIEGGAAHKGLDFVVDSLESMRPMLEKFNIVEKDFDFIGLRQKLHGEAAKHDYCIAYPRLVGASLNV